MATDATKPTTDSTDVLDQRPLVAGLLQLLQHQPQRNGLAPAADLHAELARRLEETVRTFTGELRAELTTWRDAAEALRRLSECRLLPDVTTASALLDELTRAGVQARQLLRSLESARPAAPLTTEPASTVETTEHAAALDQTLDVIPLAPQPPHANGATAPVDPDPGPDSDTALECLRAGDASRRRGDYADALHWYAEALRRDPGSARAHLRRGQTFLLEGRTEHAIEELTAAARLAPNDAEPYLRRGDALARLGQWRRALDDYGRAIRLRPDLPLARHNRAVVCSLAGDHTRAIAELTIVLEMDPSYAPAYFNRGAAHLALGQSERAVEDLTRVLELAPGDDEARAKLEEACQLRDAQAAEALLSLTPIEPPPPPRPVAPAPIAATPRPAPAPTPPAAAPPRPAPAPTAPSEKAEPRRNGPPSAPTNGTTKRPAERTMPAAPTNGTTEQPAPATPPAPSKPAPTPTPQAKTERPAGKTAPEAPKNDPGDLIVVCPDCGAIGAVRFDRLDRILVCKGCARLYRVREDGQLAAVTRNAAGRWIDRSRLRPFVERLGLTPPRLLLLGVLLLGMLATAAWRFSGSTEMALPEEPLPQELEPRAELLARSWLRRDVRTMRRLALYTHERAVFPWLHRHPPPLKRKAEKDDLEGARFEIQLRRRAGKVTDLVVRVHGVPIARQAGPIEMAQRWVERGESWEYLPPSH